MTISNGTRITRRADPGKTHSVTRLTTYAKAPMLRGPIGPVGFMRWLGGRFMKPDHLSYYYPDNSL